MSQFGVQIHEKSHRKSSGNGKLKLKNRDKRRHEVGSYFTATKLGAENTVNSIRARGGNTISKLKNAAFANVLTGSGYKKAKITSVVESKDNRNFARLNIITKGTIIETELGKAQVINRPGREGTVTARLVEGR
jgi:small subunit ribosomal protein S8e